jgi:Tfp pilus assembly protein PilP
MKKINLLCLLLLFSSCSPNSAQEFQKEGEAHCRYLVLELQKIEDREQLIASESKLKKRFEELIDLIIEAREYQQKQIDSDEAAFEENSFEEPLEKELRRIYTIEGGREVIERAQHEALVRLDAYERTLAKKREVLHK